MSALSSPLGLIGLAVLIVFTVVAFRRPGRSVVLYGVLAATPSVVQLGAFSGRTSSQGFLVAEALASVLIVAWIARRATAPHRVAMPFEPLLWAFVGVACLSLVMAVALPDPRIALEASTMVSLGQVMLIVWPIGVYLAAADGIANTQQVRTLHRVILGLAACQLLTPLLPDRFDPFTAWAANFGLFAVPIAVASLFARPSLLAACFYLVVAVIPFVRGVVDGKAFLYAFVVVSAGAVVVLRAPRVLAVLGGTAVTVTLAFFALGGQQRLESSLVSLIQKERSQSSWEGQAGRVALAQAAVSIWAEAPMLGVGPGNSYLYMLQRSPIGTPHNQYFNILAEFGLLGLAAWLAFLGAAARTGLRIYRHVRAPEHQTYALAWIGMFAGMAAGGLTGDYSIHSIRNGGLELFSGYYLQWVLLGTLAALPRLEYHAAHVAARPQVVAAVDPVRRFPPGRRRLSGRAATSTEPSTATS